MGLAKIVGKIATHDELVEVLQEMEKEQIKLRGIVTGKQANQSDG